MIHHMKPKIGKTLKKLRCNKKLSQFDLAVLAGVKPLTILRIENGITKLPNDETLEGLARALETTTKSLLYGTAA